MVRLAGIEVPAPPLDDESPGSDALAALARTALAAAIRGANLELVSGSENKPDRHGRIPSYVRLTSGATLQEILIDAGYARARWLPGEVACFLAFRRAEAGAEKARRGIWNSPDYAIRPAEDASLLSSIGLYELVEGRVVSVGHGTRMIFLDFGQDYRRDFTVMITPKVAEGLVAASFPPDALVGRRVRVRGVIEEGGGPAIRLNNAAELEVRD